MSDYDNVLIERLMEYHDFRELGMTWDSSHITLNDISNGIHNGICEESEQYVPNLLEFDSKTKEWHIGRIIYFINNPEKITPIFLDNKCVGLQILPEPLIDDGHHRLMAKLYLNEKEITVAYSGRVDVLNYLTGKTNEMPL